MDTLNLRCLSDTTWRSEELRRCVGVERGKEVCTVRKARTQARWPGSGWSRGEGAGFWARPRAGRERSQSRGRTGSVRWKARVGVAPEAREQSAPSSGVLWTGQETRERNGQVSSDMEAVGDLDKKFQETGAGESWRGVGSREYGTERPQIRVTENTGPGTSLPGFESLLCLFLAV